MGSVRRSAGPLLGSFYRGEGRTVQTGDNLEIDGRVLMVGARGRGCSTVRRGVAGFLATAPRPGNRRPEWAIRPPGTRSRRARVVRDEGTDGGRSPGGSGGNRLGDRGGGSHPGTSAQRELGRSARRPSVISSRDGPVSVTESDRPGPEGGASLRTLAGLGRRAAGRIVRSPLTRAAPTLSPADGGEGPEPSGGGEGRTQAPSPRSRGEGWGEGSVQACKAVRVVRAPLTRAAPTL